MIFVTVGTHEQPFNRLIKEIDILKGKKIIIDDVFIQTGFSNYIPINCKWERFISFELMEKYSNQANLIITHGGPASFMKILNLGKIPIVVPRQVSFSEHVNNHQLDFARKVKEKGYKIIIIENIGELSTSIINYQNFKTHDKKERVNNFAENFEIEMNKLFKSPKL